MARIRELFGAGEQYLVLFFSASQAVTQALLRTVL